MKGLQIAVFLVAAIHLETGSAQAKNEIKAEDWQAVAVFHNSG